MQLSGLGVGTIKLLDCDEVELKNLNRQILYSEKVIGQRKMKVGVERLRDYNSLINFEGIDKRITCSQDLDQIITNDIDFVFCAADSPPILINKWVNEHCVKKRIPFISGGVGLSSGSFYSILPGTTACFECYESYINEKFSNVMEAYNVVDNDFNTAIMVNVSMLASMIISEFMRIHLGLVEPISLGRKTIINFSNSQITKEKEWIRNSTCKVCSKLS